MESKDAPSGSRQLPIHSRGCHGFFDSMPYLRERSYRMTRRMTRWMSFVLVLLTTPLVLGHDGVNRRSGSVKVMTRNLYFGADVFRVLEAQSPFDLSIKVAEILKIIRQSNPPERMEAIADEIARKRPELIGLQEAFLIRTQFPGDLNATPAVDVEFDYLDLLLAALDRRGLDYRVASLVQNVDVELPGFDGFDSNGIPLFFDGRVTDRDVILVRGDVGTANAMSQNYTFNVPVSIAGAELEFLRGFTSVDAWVRGRKYHFVNTHLEVDFQGPALAFQALQAQELLGILAAADDPVIVVGDFNSDPDDPVVDDIVPPYRQFAWAGYVDAWAAKRGRARPGDTCCHAELLDNPEPQLNRRIDLIWARNTANGHGPPIGPIQAVVVGEEVRDLTSSGRWPSDHAGGIARMRLSVPR